MIAWIKYRINSRSSRGPWQWKPIAVSSLSSSEAEEEAAAHMREMISEEAAHSEHGRSGDWSVEEPPPEVVQAAITQLEKKIMRQHCWLRQLKGELR